MARTVPGSGAVIEPIFDEIFGVRAVKVVEGGTGYSQSDPPRLTVTGCGTPDEEALLYPIIDTDSGKIVHVRVLTRGSGYDPLRLQIVPQQETPNVINSFDFNRIWQTHPNSPTSGSFAVVSNEVTDRLTIVSDNDPKPTPISTELVPGGGPLTDRTFNQTFIFRGGKDVPEPGTRILNTDKVTGILANGGLLHTPGWGTDGNVFPGFEIDAVKYNYVKSNNIHDTVVEGNVQYYQSSKSIDQFALANGVFQWGKFKQYTWTTKIETDNIMLEVNTVDESLGAIEVGRIVDEVAGNARGEIAKVVRNNSNVVTRIYLRQLAGGDNNEEFASGDTCLGSNGFTFKIAAVPTELTGVYYIEFGTNAADFGAFSPGTYYFAPENIKVEPNYLIKFNQSDSTNNNHPIRFSTTADGTLNSGTLYYNSTGASSAPSADYENQYQPLFIMNSDETAKIYYHCANHRYMSGYAGDEGYMIIDGSPNNTDALTNNYYVEKYYQSDANDPATIDYSRHVDGHSKIVGMSYDGYPIYGPFGYKADGTVAREVSGFRLRTSGEHAGNRPEIVTASTVTYAVTIANGKFLIDGTAPQFLTLKRGKTYIFNQNDSSNDSEHMFVSTTEDGWHVGAPPTIGDTSKLYTGNGISYWIDGSEVTYTAYLSGFNLATTREMRWTIAVDSPAALYMFGYTTALQGFRTVQEGYILGDLIEDYIWDTAVANRTLDVHNGKFASTPEYPNGTYAYYMTEDGSGNPAYPYAIAPTYYSTPLFEGDNVPASVSNFPTTATGDVVLADNGSVSYIKMTKTGDNYFGAANANILGGEGSGAVGTPTVQTVTGLSLINAGRDYLTPPTLLFEGGGGQGAQGAAEIDTLGRVTGVTIVDNGEFYQEAPFVLITGGGGSGAKAIATINQGEISGIIVTDPGTGYTSPPKIVFTKLVNLKRKTRARQANNSNIIYLTGLVADVTASATDIFVNSTDAYPGSGSLILNTETIAYTSKVEGKFSGLTRGVNFNYDQRVILDDSQIDNDGVSTYKFNVGDRVIRKVENENNKIAKVYDWNPNTRELLVTFEVDELAYIDGGRPSTEDAIVQFDAGIYESTNSNQLPHIILTSAGDSIPLLTDPLSTLANSKFQDILPTAAGDGIPDLVNTGTGYDNQIKLDGGIYNSLYGIEEELGGTNTTLFAVGDNIKDASIPFKYSTVLTAGGLSEGVEHIAQLKIQLDTNDGNGQNFGVNEVITGQISGVKATVVSWDANTSILTVKDITPYNTGNVNVGIGGLLYEFSYDSTVVDFFVQSSGTNYTAAPNVAIENIGDIEATATVNMTTAGDQVASLTITNGGYGIKQSVDASYNLHPIVTFSNAAGDTTGSGAVAYVIMGGEEVQGTAGAKYRIKSIEYQTTARSK